MERFQNKDGNYDFFLLAISRRNAVSVSTSVWLSISRKRIIEHDIRSLRRHVALVTRQSVVLHYTAVDEGIRNLPFTLR